MRLLFAPTKFTAGLRIFRRYSAQKRRAIHVTGWRSFAWPQSNARLSAQRRYLVAAPLRPTFRRRTGAIGLQRIHDPRLGADLRLQVLGRSCVLELQLLVGEDVMECSMRHQRRLVKS